MVQHEGQAHLTLRKSGLLIPHLQDAFAELVGGRPASARWGDEWKQAVLDPPRSKRHEIARAVAPRVAKVVGPIVGFMGLRTTERWKLELFEELLRGRYFLAGGSAAGDYLEQEVMEHVFKNTAIFSTPASVDVHLYTSSTSDANSTGTEVSGGSYAAENVAAAGWDAPGSTGGATANSADTDFGTASANWGTVSHVSIEMPSAANRLFHGALSASKTVNNGDSFKFPTGDLDVSFA